MKIYMANENNTIRVAVNPSGVIQINCSQDRDRKLAEKLSQSLKADNEIHYSFNARMNSAVDVKRVKFARQVVPLDESPKTITNLV